MKKLANPVRKVNTQCVGLDVHKNLTVICVLDSEGSIVREDRMASTREAFERLVQETHAAGPAHFTFEASRSSLWVHGLLAEHMDPSLIHVAQAKRIRAIANSNSKNDERDAFWLAYLTYEGRLPEAHVPPRTAHCNPRESRLCSRTDKDHQSSQGTLRSDRGSGPEHLCPHCGSTAFHGQKGAGNPRHPWSGLAWLLVRSGLLR